MSMTQDQAEERIVACVKRIDELRAAAGDDITESFEQIVLIEQEIIELKKITGPRKLSGTCAFYMPMLGASSGGAPQDFDQWNSD